MLQLETPFPARVASFYRERGYQVTEQARVRGASGNVFAVPLVADGPLGALLVSFGDAAGIDAEEVARVRTMARDIGATPVIAARQLEPALRRLAAQMAVVVLDLEALGSQPPLPPAPAAVGHRDDLEAHPWPDSGRVRPIQDAGSTRAVDVDDMLASILEARPRPGPGVRPSTATTAPPPGGPTGLAQAESPVPASPALLTAPAPFSWLAASPPVPQAVGVPVASHAGLAGAAPSPASATASLPVQAGVPAASGADASAIAAAPLATLQTVVPTRMPITRRTVRRAIGWGLAGAAGLFVVLWWFGGA